MLQLSALCFNCREPKPKAIADSPARKYPQFQQQDIFGLQDAFRKLDVDDKGYIDEATVIKATQTSERQPYDVVRGALKQVELDSSRRVELDDYVDVSMNHWHGLLAIRFWHCTACQIAVG